MHVFPRALCGALLIALAALTGLQPAPAQARPASQATDLPAGFTDEEITTLSGEMPTDLARTPDGRVLISTQAGRVWVVENGARNAAPALDLAAAGVICSEFERGLQSVEVDPDFATRPYIYIFHTFNGGTGGADCSGRAGITNRVLRYRLLPDNTLAEPTVILANIASPCGNHNGGDLHFGADGLLYISTGDGGVGDSSCQVPGGETNNARYLSLLNGKILRINPDGSIPSSNPFAGAEDAGRCGAAAANVNGGPCQETFAWGFRNPFRFAFKHGTTQLYVNDVGASNWEEISDVTAGNDYGWHCREGRHDNPAADDACAPPLAAAIDPIYDYPHGGPLCSITGGAFAVTGGAWPAPYDGSYFFGDFCSNAIYRLIESNGAYRHETFARISPGSSIIALLFDPSEDALFYTTSRGRVGVIRHAAGGNSAPIAAASAAPTNGAVPLKVQFSSAGSADPNGDALTYRWNFGDGSPSSSAPNPTHTYAVSGTWNASLVVADARGAVSAPARVVVYPGSQRPTVTIDSPAADARFIVGQAMTLTGSAVDERGSDISSTMQWRVVLHHVPAAHPETAHAHPVFTGMGDNRRLPALPAPEDLDAAARSYVEVQLTARDVKGLTQTVTQTLQPARVALTFAPDPGGLRLTMNGAPITATRTVTSWQGYGLNVAAPLLQRDSSGQWWRFVGWSDGGAASHRIKTPAGAATFTARYEKVATVRQRFLPLVGK